MASSFLEIHPIEILMSNVSGVEHRSRAFQTKSVTYGGLSVECWFPEEPFLQPLWTTISGNRSIFAAPWFPIALSLFCYFTSTIPYSFLDFYGYRHWAWVRGRKIQPEVQVTWSHVRDGMTLTAWNQLLYVIPISVAQCVWTSETVLPTKAPSMFEMIIEPYLALIIFDAEYYAWHVLHHRVKWLYRNVHSVHHKYSSVNAWLGQYVHPWELISAGVLATTAPWILDLHPLTNWSYMALLQFVSVEDHSGYDLPLIVLPHHWLPFNAWGGAVKHDMHHQRPLTNFQPYFTWFDRLVGTDCPGQLGGGLRPRALIEYDKQKKYDGFDNSSTELFQKTTVNEEQQKSAKVQDGNKCELIYPNSFK